MTTHTTSKILIVDDVSNNIKVAANILRREPYHLFFATSGEEALARAAVQAFDLILLDVMMPGLDGFDVCARLKHNPSTQAIPVIFLTAKTDAESLVKGFELGAVDYITKPFNPTEVIARVKTHLELYHTRQALQEANAAKDKFFTIISHDLRSPFTALIGLAELIAKRFDRYSKDELRDIAAELQKSAENIYSLLENLLTWSRVQRGVIEYCPEHIELYELIGHNLLLLRAGAAQKQITLKNVASEDSMAYGDRNMVDTILRNLLSNALKFTSAGGSVQVSTQTLDRGLEISVSDTGTGIAADRIPDLFRIDVRHSHSGTAGEKGTGLGLVLCKELVERHGGALRVRSDVGRGSTFTFTLPHYPSTMPGSSTVRTTGSSI